MYVFKYKEFAESLYRSLGSDPFYVAMLKPLNGDMEDKKEALLKYLDYSMQEADIYGRLFIPEGLNYGVSIWSRPLNAADEVKRSADKKSFIKNNLGQKPLEIYTDMTSFMADRLQGDIPNSAWYLSILGVRPDYQGRGLGVGLVREFLQETDKQMRFTYLETFNQKSIVFYERLGYKVVKKIDEPVTGSPYWILIREPFSASLVAN